MIGLFRLDQVRSDETRIECIQMHKCPCKARSIGCLCHHSSVLSFVPQILTGTADGNVFVWDGGQSLHAKHLVQIEEAHDLAVLALQVAPIVSGEANLSWILY